ncbi:hypothetical protein ACHAXS_007928 [Conticribra weissflogii]
MSKGRIFNINHLAILTIQCHYLHTTIFVFRTNDIFLLSHIYAYTEVRVWISFISFKFLPPPADDDSNNYVSTYFISFKFCRALLGRVIEQEGVGLFYYPF